MISTKPLTDPSAANGFTLLELLVTVAVAAVLAMIAVPNMSIFIQNNARSSRMNELTTAFNIARNEAISKQVKVTVCASNTLPAPATYSCSGSQAFANGWIVMTDAGVEGTIDGTDTVLRVFEPDMAGSATLNGTDSAGTAVPRVSFDSSGLTTGLTITMTGVRFTYCDARGLGAASRAIIMTRSGHTKVSKDTDGNKIHEVGGVNLTSC